MNRVGIVDYGMGNLMSMASAFDMLGADVSICRHPEDLGSCDRIVLPGVGAFDACMEALAREGFAEALAEQVLQQGKPFLGVCLGMQVLAKSSEEGGQHRGLGWIDAEVRRLAPSDPKLRVPQIGWNDVDFPASSPLFRRIPALADFYFVHSYHMVCSDPENVEATCDYGGRVTAAVRQGNVFATQFHPEKSQTYGLQLLENFIDWQV